MTQDKLPLFKTKNQGDISKVIDLALMSIHERRWEMVTETYANMQYDLFNLSLFGVVWLIFHICADKIPFAFLHEYVVTCQ